MRGCYRPTLATHKHTDGRKVWVLRFVPHINFTKPENHMIPKLTWEKNSFWQLLTCQFIPMLNISEFLCKPARHVVQVAPQIMDWLGGTLVLALASFSIFCIFFIAGDLIISSASHANRNSGLYWMLSLWIYCRQRTWMDVVRLGKSCHQGRNSLPMASVGFILFIGALLAVSRIPSSLNCDFRCLAKMQSLLQ